MFFFSFRFFFMLFTQTASLETLGVSTRPGNRVIEKIVMGVPERLFLAARLVCHRIRDVEKVLQELGRDIYSITTKKKKVKKLVNVQVIWSE
jgi:hypothetical protein